MRCLPSDLRMKDLKGVHGEVQGGDPSARRAKEGAWSALTLEETDYNQGGIGDRFTESAKGLA